MNKSLRRCLIAVRVAHSPNLNTRSHKNSSASEAAAKYSAPMKILLVLSEDPFELEKKIQDNTTVTSICDIIHKYIHRRRKNTQKIQTYSVHTNAKHTYIHITYSSMNYYLVSLAIICIMVVYSLSKPVMTVSKTKLRSPT